MNFGDEVKGNSIKFTLKSQFKISMNFWLYFRFAELTLNPPEGIVAGPLSEDNFFEWEALIAGPEGTCFEGGVFPARLIFPPDYPLSPPKMKFTCEMFHPNSEFVDSEWKLVLTLLIFSILRWSSVYQYIARTGRRSYGLWTVRRKMESCAKCWKDFT